MIPLQIIMIGMRWQMGAMLVIVVALLIFGWRRLNSFDLPQNWRAILFLLGVDIWGDSHSLPHLETQLRR